MRYAGDPRPLTNYLSSVRPYITLEAPSVQESHLQAFYVGRMTLSFYPNQSTRGLRGHRGYVGDSHRLRLYESLAVIIEYIRSVYSHRHGPYGAARQRGERTLACHPQFEIRPALTCK